MSLQKTVTVSQKVFATIPGRGVNKDVDYYRGQVIGLIVQLGAEEYGISKGDIIFSLNIDVADGSKRCITFRIRPVLIQVETQRQGKAKELVPKPATSWYLLWKHLEMKIATIKVGIVEAQHELMQYISLPDQTGQWRSFADILDVLIESDTLNQVSALEDLS